MGDAYRIYDNNTPPVTHISLCSGYGGIDIGLKRAIPNLLTIAYAEREAFPCANLVSKMEEGFLDAAPIWSDLKEFPWEDFRGVVDIVSGGFPCQPFSQAGKRNADGDERHLFPYILDGIRKCRPSFVFLENVEGIISAKLSGDGWSDPAGTPVLLHVLRELERVGYKATAGVFSASEVGAPHQRKRIFIMGYSKHNGLLTLTKLRGNEETSSKRRQEEQAETRQLEGTSRPTNVSGLQGCECGSELGNTESIGTLRQRSSRLKEPHSSAKKGLSISANEGLVYSSSKGLSTTRDKRGLGETSSGIQEEEYQSPVKPQLPSSPSGGEAMGDSYSNGGRQSRKVCQGTDGSVAFSDGETGRVELAYGKNERCGGRSDRDGNDSRGISEQETQLKPVFRSKTTGRCGDSREAMANTNIGGQPSSINPRSSSKEDSGRQSNFIKTCGVWPSRPGQPQYEWEPPRVVAMENSNSTRGRGKGRDTLHQGRTTSQGGSEGLPQDSIRRDGLAVTDNQSAGRDGNQATNNEAQSSVGGNIDGPTSGMVYAELCHTCDSRNDELRLLGNGVVPQTCTKAFVTLLQRLIDG